MTQKDEKNLEQLVDRALRDLPMRRAPSSLEARVQAEIARRAALPWWHKSFSYWPIAARGAFVVATAGVAKLVLMAVVWVTAGYDVAEFKAGFATELGWLQAASSFVHTVVNLGGTLVSLIPPLWLYGGLAIVAALYVALFGLGAAAYRTLYASS